MKENRRLIYVPILHAQEDAGRTDSILSNKKIRRGQVAKGVSAVEEMWKGIAAKIGELNISWEHTRIYHDGMPVCSNEVVLARRLAESGSPDLSFICKLIESGAILEGTEDMDLLIQEYDLLNKLLMNNVGADQAASNAEYQSRSRGLLALRDQFILNRIGSTLQPGELPLVFMGVMHRLDKMLENDFAVSYVIYRLPFRSIGTIYNA
ncbi:hypothetical protein [uncultured Thiodictyon sp.]|uniref:hypothetical protein n=1 Tax=uncultured Thiodictyon sp. TaxID=1846217 RepID=UPI0025E96F56|nr:hypothetical protein [uncultured Thiodictyon sp.]